MIRSLNLADGERMKELQAMQCLDYFLPEIPAFTVKRGYEHEGQIVCAILARPTVELYMLADPKWASPAWRHEALKMLHEDVRQELLKAGIESAVMWLPPEKEKSFSRRLAKYFGWVTVRWKCMARLTNA